MMKKILPVLALLTMTLVGCKDDEPGTPRTSGSVLVDLTNVVGSVNLDETGATWYTNASGESFSVTRLKYYLSNFELIRNDEVKYKLENGYFLVDESNQASTVLELPDVPAGQYDKIRFLIGVDSARNVSGAQTGALDPANGMFWTWSTGYIFYKLEGKSPASANVDSTFNYHIAGFRESNNTNSLRWVELSFNGSTLTVDGDREAEVHIFADHLRFFDGPPNQMTITGNYNVMTPGPRAQEFADNYAQLFRFDHLHNSAH
jgi:hypothetical protein